MAAKIGNLYNQELLSAYVILIIWVIRNCQADKNTD